MQQPAPPAVQPVAGGARPRLSHIDGLRAVAALVVFLNHAYAQVWGVGAGPGGVFGLARWSLVAGHLAVTVFIVLSGFCLMLPVLENQGVLRGGVRTFLIRRARRILPPYYAALALSLLLIATIIGKETGTLWDVPLRLDYRSIIAHVLLLQDLFATGHINYVFWSIAVEWQIYFLMPLLLILWRKIGPIPVIVITLFLGYWVRGAYWDTRIWRMHPHFVGMFAAGMLAAQLARSNTPLIDKLREVVPWTFLCFAGLLVAAVMAKLESFPLLDMPVAFAAFCALVAASAPGRGLLREALSVKPLVFVGTFSYSLYLIHAPLLQVLWQYVCEPLGMSPEQRFVLLMTLGLALILGASYLFFLMFEAPFMVTSKARAEARRAAAPVP